MRNTRFLLLWRSVARGKQQEKGSLASRVCQGQPSFFQPDGQSSPSFLLFPKMTRNAKGAFFVPVALGRAQETTGETLTSKSGLPELALLLAARSPASPVASLRAILLFLRNMKSPHSKSETNPPWLRHHFEPFLA